MSYDVRFALSRDSASPGSEGRLRLFISPSAFPNPQRLRLFLYEKGAADRFDEMVTTWPPAASSANGRIPG